ncbi:MAG TPA: MOSC domain-containing protein [Thermoleophilaceae bacterium]
MAGVVEGIFTGAVAEGPLEAAEQVQVATHAGIEGDRHGDKDITLFEAEAIEGLEADTGIDLKPSEIRRNVMTRGISLNDLLGHRIRVGEVEAVVTELCHPCSHLQKLTQPGVLRGLVNRGGLNADVVAGGTIQVGDQIEDLGPTEHSSTDG